MKKLLALIVATIALSIGGFYSVAFAADHAVTGGSNGPGCNDGGYFTPSSLTVNDGDTITFSVPADDPYPEGLQVNGFPQGSFTIAKGGKLTTQAIHSNISYSGTWPDNSACKKGSGTVTLAASTSPQPTEPSAPDTTTPSTGDTPTPTTTQAADSAQTSATPEASSSSNKTLPIIGIIVVVMAAGGGYILYRSKKKPKTPSQ